jgi:RNA polymerase sigma-70 factor, ECF subfamily
MASAVACRRAKNPTSRFCAADPDADLMLRVKGDEPGAFAELTERFRARIFARLYRIVPDRQEAEDMTQDVFLRVYRARRRYRPRALFTTWLFHVTQNVARNTLRRRRRQAWLRFGQLDPDAIDGPEWPGCRTAEPPSAALERRELVQAVRCAVAELVGRQRTALEMRQFQNCTYAEIADALALSPEATKSLLYRARLQLRTFLDAIL